MNPSPRSDVYTLEHQRTRIDYSVFIATLQALQLATTTAAAQSFHSDAAPEMGVRVNEPLVEILLGGKDWRKAVFEQRGSFNPVLARRSEAN